MIGRLLGGAPERTDPPPLRRRGKETRERLLAAVLFALTSPLFAACSAAIKIEGLLDPSARGPVFFREQRASRGRVIDLLKFRTLRPEALEELGPGPTHIKELEAGRNLTRTGRALKQWYLDELPQLWNIVRGDMFLVGTRPYPIEPYEEELAAGIMRKFDMPAGLVGPVQASKGSGTSDVALDAQYWEEFQHAGAWELLRLDLKVLRESLRTQLRHEGL